MKKFIPILAVVMAGCIIHRHQPRAGSPDGPPMTKTDLERLAAAGVSDTVTVELLERRGAVKLSPDDVVAVKKAGASDAAVQKALTSERQEPPLAMAEEPVYYYHHYYPYYWWYPHWYWYPTFSFGYHRWSRHGRVGIGFGW